MPFAWYIESSRLAIDVYGTVCTRAPGDSYSARPENSEARRDAPAFLGVPPDRSAGVRHKASLGQATQGLLALVDSVLARGICSGTARAEMAHRAKAALAHSSPIKPGSATLSSSAKWHQNHAPKVATLCQSDIFCHDNVTSHSRAAGQPGPGLRTASGGARSRGGIPPSRTWKRHVRRTTPEPEKPARRRYRAREAHCTVSMDSSAQQL
jgi:hypothetical protein